MEEKGELERIFKTFLKILYEFIKTIALIFLIFFIVRYFLVQPFIVEGNSMEPNFHDNEYLLVDKISYKFREPKRGEVVVFRPPNRAAYYIKRIIALPGEKIVIQNSKVILYNKNNPDGITLSENYLPENGKTPGDVSQILKEGQYFVIGDNRESSADSREFGSLPKENIAGRAFVVIIPISKFGLIKRPEYEFSFWFSPFVLRPF